MARTRAHVTWLILTAVIAGCSKPLPPAALTPEDQQLANEARAQIGLYKASIELFKLDMSRYPTNDERLAALTDKSPIRSDGWKGPYFDGTIPNDPWGNAYRYASPPVRGRDGFPDIWSVGPDGEDGTSDDIGNWNGSDLPDLPTR